MIMFSYTEKIRYATLLSLSRKPLCFVFLEQKQFLPSEILVAIYIYKRVCGETAKAVSHKTCEEQ